MTSNQSADVAERTISEQLFVRGYKANDFEGLFSRVEAYYSEDQRISFDRNQLQTTIAVLTQNPTRG